MHDAYATSARWPACPTPSTTASSTPASPSAAAWRGSSTSRSSSPSACPLALFFGLATLGFGFALFPLIVAGVGFLYRTATLAGASATLGMRFTGIEFRRGDGTRFDLLTRLLHTAIYTVCISVVVLQLVSCLTILGTRYRPEHRRHHPRHHRDQPPGRLNRPRAFTARRESCCRPGGPVATLGSQGETTGPHMRHTSAAVAPVLRDGSAAVPVPARQGRAQALHRPAGRRRAPPQRRALAPGLPPLAERALPPVLRRLLRLPLGAHRGGRASPPRAASAGCCAATRIWSGSRAALGRPRRSTTSSAATSTPATPPAAWPTWT